MKVYFRGYKLQKEGKKEEERNQQNMKKICDSI